QALLSFQALGSSIHAAPPVARAAIGIVRVPRVQAGRTGYAALAARSLALRQLVPNFAALSPLIFPDSLNGAVFTWSTSSGTYVHTGSGGPANGIQFRLYAVDLSGQPVLPLTEIGYVDLLDETVGGTARLHIQVKNVASSITYLDYVF